MDDPDRPSNRPSIGTRIATRQFVIALAQDLVRGVRALRSSLRRLLPLVYAALMCAMFVLVAGGGAMLWVLNGIPLQVRSTVDGPSLLVEAADGTPLGRVGTFGNVVPRSAIPDVLVDAVLSIEDRRFFDHSGIDLRGVARASYKNWTAGAIVEGGSSITQQLAKLQLVGNERNFGRKFREALLAFWLETKFSKDEILARYMNTVYLGGGVYGMSAAARHYFDTDLRDIDVAQAAMLAGLIQAPARYNPVVNPEAARRRAGLVIDAMIDANQIDAVSAVAAKAQAATLRLSQRTEPASSWFADWIARHEFPKMAGTTARPMRVRTSLNPELQVLAQRIVRQSLERDGAHLGVSQAALVALRPNGAVVAMVGGRDYDQSQFNRAVDARRQPGSAFKLFVFYAALRQGYGVDDVIDASPISIKSWRPENYGGRVFDHLTLADAFAQSANSAAVRLALDVGLPNVVSAARELGLTSPITEVPSMALGTNEVTLLDLTAAFAAVRAGRSHLEPWGIAAFGPEGSSLRQLSEPSGSARPLAKREELAQLLEHVVTSGTGRAAAIADDAVAGKTGTSQDYRDAWFVGYSRELIVGVWVGNDDQTSMNHVTGGTLPARIWREFVAAATPELGARVETAPESGAMNPPESAAEFQSPKCDVKSCAAEYASFRASDCTYQPYVGPRRMCDLRSSVVTAARHFAPASAAEGTCAADLCASRFRSFDAATCSYQPYGGGPRAMCDLRSRD